MKIKRVYHESSRDIPVYNEFEVVVAGGGTAGMIAGLAAARAGAKTLVIERLNCLGGNSTAGLMTTTWTFNDQQKQIVKGIPYEFIKRLEEINGTLKGDISRETFTIYDIEKAKFVMSKMYAEEKNLKVLYYTMIADVIVENNKVKGVIIQNKSGRQAVYAKAVVDATGDADVAAYAGAEFMLAEKKNLHPISLLGKMCNVDFDEMNAYYNEHPEFIGNFLGGEPHQGFHSFRLADELQRITLPSELEYIRDWFILYYQTPNPGEMIINMTGATEVDGTNAEEVSDAEDLSRKRLMDALEVFNKHIPGFKNAYYTSTASSIGIRETRRITGKIILTAELMLAGTRFEDAICSYSAPVADHTKDGKSIVFRRLEPGNSYDIPLSSMIPKEIDGIIVAGRCISVEASAIGSTRNMTSCMAMGQGAGIVAAICARDGIVPRKIPNDVLRKELLAQGVYLEGISNK